MVIILLCYIVHFEGWETWLVSPRMLWGMVAVQGVFGGLRSIWSVNALIQFIVILKHLLLLTHFAISKFPEN